MTIVSEPGLYSLILRSRKPEAKALGYQYPSQAIQDHCKKASKISQVSDLANMLPVNLLIIPESDVYRLIMRSNLPNAEAFQDWVTEEVLPTIRKTGMYAMPQSLPEALRALAADVCSVLEHTNPTVALASLDEDERAKESLGRQGETNIISESGLYALVLRSNKPNAKEFARWVRKEVLPSIRKSGMYGMPSDLIFSMQ